VKTLVQCDFDGTITDKDVSFLLLNTFGNGNWRELLKEYHAGKMSVGAFNTRAFAMVSADRDAQLNLIFNSGAIKIRPGFPELVDYCSGKGFEFVIVSNGEDFYIEAYLQRLGLGQIKFHAATVRFDPAGLEVSYIGPDGMAVDNGFKETYTRLFLSQGYRIIYIGNGASDIYPARLSHHVFATGGLLKKCREEKLACTPFEDLNEVVQALKKLALE